LIATIQPDVITFILPHRAGVEHSIEHPQSFIVQYPGFFNVLEGYRKFPVEHLIYASSSVYGTNSALPFKESDRTDQPISLWSHQKAGEI
jgi:UDP-glucuronate 4-epimerase